MTAEAPTAKQIADADVHVRVVRSDGRTILAVLTSDRLRSLIRSKVPSVTSTMPSRIPLDDGDELSYGVRAVSEAVISSYPWRRYALICDVARRNQGDWRPLNTGEMVRICLTEALTKADIETRLSDLREWFVAFLDDNLRPFDMSVTVTCHQGTVRAS